MTTDSHARARSFAATLAQHCPAARSRALARAIAQIFDAELRPLGIQSSQLAVLATVAVLSPCRPMDVSERLLLSRPAATRALDTLERSGWIHSDSRTARRRTLTLTLSGAKLLVRTEAPWRVAHDLVLDAIVNIPDPALLRAPKPPGA